MLRSPVIILNQNTNFKVSSYTKRGLLPFYFLNYKNADQKIIFQNIVPITGKNPAFFSPL